MTLEACFNSPWELLLASDVEMNYQVSIEYVRYKLLEAYPHNIALADKCEIS